MVRLPLPIDPTIMNAHQRRKARRNKTQATVLLFKPANRLLIKAWLTAIYAMERRSPALYLQRVGRIQRVQP